LRQWIFAGAAPPRRSAFFVITDAIASHLW
jgi:hypothetical protein